MRRWDQRHARRGRLSRPLDRRRYRRRGTVAALLLTVAAALGAIALLAVDTGPEQPASSGGPTGPHGGGGASRYYVAIGASEVLGYQPDGPGAEGPTNQGYTNDLVTMEKARWPGLQLVRFACPGLRVDTALSGQTTNPPGSYAARTSSGRCRRTIGSEVGSAAAFIRAHAGEVALVTVDLGFPDVQACATEEDVAAACVTAALARVRAALPTVVSRLRAAGGSSLRIVGLDHEDPYIGDYIATSSTERSFAVRTVGAIERLNRTVNETYASDDVRVAEVGAAFDTGSTTPADLPGSGVVPLEVERICTLTWICADGDAHPNAKGYRTIASVVAATVAAGR